MKLVLIGLQFGVITDFSGQMLTFDGHWRAGEVCPSRIVNRVPHGRGGVMKYAPSVFEKYVSTVTYGGKEIRLNLYDTAGQDDYDRLRPLSYQNANLVLVCYDVTNPTSFENVLIKWYPEVNHFCRDVPVILIGCKTDLRKDKERTRRLKAMDQAPITYTQGEETRRHMSAELYLECSAKYRENVEDIFRDATKKALASSRRARHRTKKRHCVIL
ncbi:rho-related GTP-binding protein RhoF-like isoform X1 [Salvelinus fontinalis]|uniref:rho-related GTP-binding protein RhoF-like isoform X1 n=1 Tax=Salvelinus fontinalis TaxID=8038 RepID=UPI0024859A74|nr:rho-related GTP-binding protein RhoF-like isoform X1 [Salvelinus fontinalis]